jgi:hypothetical protein
MSPVLVLVVVPVHMAALAGTLGGHDTFATFFLVFHSTGATGLDASFFGNRLAIYSSIAFPVNSTVRFDMMWSFGWLVG